MEDVKLFGPNQHQVQEKNLIPALPKYNDQTNMEVKSFNAMMNNKANSYMDKLKPVTIGPHGTIPDDV